MPPTPLSPDLLEREAEFGSVHGGDARQSIDVQHTVRRTVDNLLYQPKPIKKPRIEGGASGAGSIAARELVQQSRNQLNRLALIIERRQRWKHFPSRGNVPRDRAKMTGSKRLHHDLSPSANVSSSTTFESAQSTTKSPMSRPAHATLPTGSPSAKVDHGTSIRFPPRASMPRQAKASEKPSCDITLILDNSAAETIGARG